MELNKKMSDIIKIVLAILAVLMLLAVGAALGSRFSQSGNNSDNFNYHRRNGFERGNRDDFGRGDRNLREGKEQPTVDCSGQKKESCPGRNNLNQPENKEILVAPTSTSGINQPIN